MSGLGELHDLAGLVEFEGRRLHLVVGVDNPMFEGNSGVFDIGGIDRHQTLLSSVGRQRGTPSVSNSR